MYMEVQRTDEFKVVGIFAKVEFVRVVSNIIVQVRLQLDLESYSV